MFKYQFCVAVHLIPFLLSNCKMYPVFIVLSDDVPFTDSLYSFKLSEMINN